MMISRALLCIHHSYEEGSSVLEHLINLVRIQEISRKVLSGVRTYELLWGG